MLTSLIAGGSIVGSANINFNLTGDLQTVGDASFSILNGGGTIGGDSSIGSADNHFTLTGDLTASGDANFLIDNSSGGMIGGNTAINVDAANITANSLLAQINNTSGTIGGNANLSLNLTGDLTTQGDAMLTILNDTGGMIGVGCHDQRDRGQHHFNRRAPLMPRSSTAAVVAVGTSSAAPTSTSISTGDLHNCRRCELHRSLTRNGGMIGADAAIERRVQPTFQPAASLNASDRQQSVARSVEAPISRLISAANWPRRATRASRSITPMVE